MEAKGIMHSILAQNKRRLISIAATVVVVAVFAIVSKESALSVLAGIFLIVCPASYLVGEFWGACYSVPKCLLFMGVTSLFGGLIIAMGMSSIIAGTVGVAGQDGGDVGAWLQVLMVFVFSLVVQIACYIAIVKEADPHVASVSFAILSASVMIILAVGALFPQLLSNSEIEQLLSMQIQLDCFQYDIRGLFTAAIQVAIAPIWISLLAGKIAKAVFDER